MQINPIQRKTTYNNLMSHQKDSAADLLLIAGIVAAIHVGKLPPAIPILSQTMGFTLVQSGFLLSLVQMAGMTLGLVIGMVTENFGLRRSILSGLSVLGLSSILASFAQTADQLLLLRTFEGLGFLFVTVPVPSLIRRLVSKQNQTIKIGLWGAYMGVGSAIALIIGAWAIAELGWRTWWVMLGVANFIMVSIIFATIPNDKHIPTTQELTSKYIEDTHWIKRIIQIIRTPGATLAAFAFAMYSGQWLAVVGFLPTIYIDSGLSMTLGSFLTAIVALANAVGATMAGRLLNKQINPRTILYLGFTVMGIGSMIAFAGSNIFPPLIRYISIILFSGVGGLIPSTLFAMAVHFAPNLKSSSASVGWVMQWSAIGQFSGPPLIAYLASQMGSWNYSWWITSTASAIGISLSFLLSRQYNK